MTTIVLNLALGAVTEYDGFDFQSITPTHAGSSLGLYEIGGDLDVIAPIVAHVETGRTEWGDAHKKHLQAVYLSMQGEGEADGLVGEYSYPFQVRDAGVSRFLPGKGIRENYLSFGFRNPGGEDFRLDKIEVAVAGSQTRRL